MFTWLIGQIQKARATLTAVHERGHPRVHITCKFGKRPPRHVLTVPLVPHPRGHAQRIADAWNTDHELSAQGRARVDDGSTLTITSARAEVVAYSISVDAVVTRWQRAASCTAGVLLFLLPG